MVPRALLLLVLLVLAVSTKAFTVTAPITTRSLSVETALEGCRVNAKKEKRKRNRENMRKFKTGGRRGTSRRKLMKKALASKARQEESEFVAKCFITMAPPEDEKK